MHFFKNAYYFFITAEDITQKGFYETHVGQYMHEFVISRLRGNIVYHNNKQYNGLLEDDANAEKINIQDYIQISYFLKKARMKCKKKQKISD